MSLPPSSVMLDLIKMKYLSGSLCIASRRQDVVQRQWCIQMVSSNLWSVCDIKYRGNLFYTQFFIKSKLDFSALSALCCSRLLIFTLYFNAFLYIIDIFLILFLLSYQRFFIFIHVFIRKMKKKCMCFQLFWQWLVYLTKQCEIMSWGYCLQ